jgi:hypothetical protein
MFNKIGGLQLNDLTDDNSDKGSVASESIDDPEEFRMKLISNNDVKQTETNRNLQPSLSPSIHDSPRHSPQPSPRTLAQKSFHLSREENDSDRRDDERRFDERRFDERRFDERRFDERRFDERRSDERRDDYERRSESRGSHHSDYGQLPGSARENSIDYRRRMLDDRREKLFLLSKIERMAEKGFALSGNFNLNSPKEDLQLEVERLEYKIEMENSVKGYKDSMMFFSGISELASRYFGVGKIGGFSEQIYGDLYNEPYKYDGVLEEIYEKNRNKPKLPPEVRLMMMFGGSLFMYHISNSMMPKFGGMMPSAPTQQPIQQNVDPNLLEKLREAHINNIQNSGGPQSMGQAPGPRVEPKIVRNEMKGPQGVDDLLKAFEQRPSVQQTDTASAVGTDIDGISLSASEIASGKMPRRRKKQPKNNENTFVLDM